ncbi:hypothetical protein ACO0R3_000342 [Hanseniaspora guilliermondii]
MGKESKTYEKEGKKLKKQLLTDEVKKKNHIESEHRRRNMIKEKHNKLISMVPKLDINHPVYKSSIERIRSLCSSDVTLHETNDENENSIYDKTEFNPDLEFVFQNSSKNNDPEKQIELLKQAIHAERSIYKLTGEYLIEENTKNIQLKGFLQYLINNGHLSDDIEKYNAALKFLS